MLSNMYKYVKNMSNFQVPFRKTIVFSCFLFMGPQTRPLSMAVVAEGFETTERFAPEEPFWGTVKRRPASARRVESFLGHQKLWSRYPMDPSGNFTVRY